MKDYIKQAWRFLEEARFQLSLLYLATSIVNFTWILWFLFAAAMGVEAFLPIFLFLQTHGVVMILLFPSERLKSRRRAWASIPMGLSMIFFWVSPWIVVPFGVSVLLFVSSKDDDNDNKPKKKRRLKVAKSKLRLIPGLNVFPSPA